MNNSLFPTECFCSVLIFLTPRLFVLSYFPSDFKELKGEEKEDLKEKGASSKLRNSREKWSRDSTGSPTDQRTRSPVGPFISWAILDKLLNHSRLQKQML